MMTEALSPHNQTLAEKRNETEFTETTLEAIKKQAQELTTGLKNDFENADSKNDTTVINVLSDISNLR